MVNDTLGHDAGDALLVEVAARLRVTVRETDDVARLGGDEFAILVSPASDPARVAHLCERIVAALDPPVTFGGQTMRTSPSIGVAFYPADGTSETELYKAADGALYRAKHAGRRTWRMAGAE